MKLFNDIAMLMPQLLDGLKITLELFICTIVLSIPLGLIISLIKESMTPKDTDRLVALRIVKRFIRIVIDAYLWIFRGTPLMLQLFFIYFGLGVSGVSIEAFPAALIAFVLNYAAYFAEIFRGGISAVDKGQYDASKALGFTGGQTMRYIVVPQMVRTVIPPVANETITLVKDTALASTIALIDLLKKAQQAVNRDMNVTAYLVVAVMYLAITLALTFIFNRIEKRLAISKKQ